MLCDDAQSHGCLAQIFTLSVSLEIIAGGECGWSEFVAKRVACASLLALWTVGLHESGSKLRALQTLRAVWLRLCCVALHRRFATCTPPITQSALLNGGLACRIRRLKICDTAGSKPALRQRHRPLDLVAKAL